MKYAILSDIHGNLQALEAVYNDLTKEQVDEIYNLGDFINYGPQSDEVVDFIIKHNIHSILGNHEYALLHEETLANFQIHARLSFLITKPLISQKSFDYIRTLPTHLSTRDLYFVHGIPPDNFSDYVFQLTDSEFSNILDSMKEKLFFAGHTHRQGIYMMDNNHLNGQTMVPNEKNKINDKAMINVGSVGQPRGKSKKAHYVIYDAIKNYVMLKTVDYDVDKTIQLLKEKNYPLINIQVLKQNRY